MSDNACTGSHATFVSVVTSKVTCGARLSILVAPPSEVQDPGHLRLIAPAVTFGNGFKATRLTVISTDPCAGCTG